jgi:putative ABC transport system substrate-binding protein
MIRRREFIAGLGAAAWPLVARGQQGERVRRITVFRILAAEDPDGVAEIAAFLQGMAQLGWTNGVNVRIEYRHGLGNPDNVRKYATELVALTPDVILSIGGALHVWP